MLRYEYKYYVPNTKLNQLRKMIADFVTLDSFAAKQPQKEYTVRSIYFDTPNFECYWTKLAGIKHRNKVRLRGYNTEHADNTVFMEIKKKFEAPLLKNRAPLRYADALRIFKGADLDNFVKDSAKFAEASDNAKRFMYHLHTRRMRPVATIIYEREPYLSKFEDKENNLRITFDKNLRACAYPHIAELYQENQVQKVLAKHFILEVKFNQYYPTWMKAIVGSLQLKKESASKYCLGLDALNRINVNSKWDTFAYGAF